MLSKILKQIMFTYLEARSCNLERIWRHHSTASFQGESPFLEGSNKGQNHWLALHGHYEKSTVQSPPALQPWALHHTGCVSRQDASLAHGPRGRLSCPSNDALILTGKGKNLLSVNKPQPAFLPWLPNDCYNYLVQDLRKTVRRGQNILNFLEIMLQ